MNRPVFFSAELLQKAVNDLEPVCFRHLVSILRFSGPSMTPCYPGRQTLMELSGVSPKNQALAERTLLEKGYLQVERRANTSNLYKPTSPMTAVSAEEMVSIPKSVLRYLAKVKGKELTFAIKFILWMAKQGSDFVESSCVKIAEETKTAYRSSHRYLSNMLENGILKGNIVKNIGVSIRNMFRFFSPPVRQKKEESAKNESPVPLASPPKTPTGEELRRRVLKKKQTERSRDEETPVCSFLDKIPQLSRQDKETLKKGHDEKQLQVAMEVLFETYGDSCDGIRSSIAFLRYAIKQNLQPRKRLNQKTLDEAEKKLAQVNASVEVFAKHIEIAFENKIQVVELHLSQDPLAFTAALEAEVEKIKQAVPAPKAKPKTPEKSSENIELNLRYLQESGVPFKHKTFNDRVYIDSRGTGVYLPLSREEFQIEFLKECKRLRLLSLA